MVLDAFSRRIVGWCVRDMLHASLVIDALHMAATQRHATDVIHHSDQGSQYRTFAFGQRCKLLGVRPSMGSRGDAYDNAIAASFSATLEVECLAKYRFTTHTCASTPKFPHLMNRQCP
ncbi:MAG: DDE-type integrase/transposase/recombinase, partial [Gemmatimonadaceae bacterium]|nr:DDE-type integrase/transposase/recombinase [Gemmatimonadaceae bacterium]